MSPSLPAAKHRAAASAWDRTEDRIRDRPGRRWDRCTAARDVGLGRRVALKALPPLHDADTSRASGCGARRGGRDDFAPPRATVYALEEIDGRLFMASEYIEGHTLRTEMTAGRSPR